MCNYGRNQTFSPEEKLICIRASVKTPHHDDRMGTHLEIGIMEAGQYGTIYQRTIHYHVWHYLPEPEKPVVWMCTVVEVVTLLLPEGAEISKTWIDHYQLAWPEYE